MDDDVDILGFWTEMDRFRRRLRPRSIGPVATRTPREESTDSGGDLEERPSLEGYDMASARLL